MHPRQRAAGRACGLWASGDQGDNGDDCACAMRVGLAMPGPVQAARGLLWVQRTPSSVNSKQKATIRMRVRERAAFLLFLTDGVFTRQVNCRATSALERA